MGVLGVKMTKNQVLLSRDIYGEISPGNDLCLLNPLQNGADNSSF